MGLIIAFWIYNANITMAKTVWLPWDHVLPCGWPENQPVVRAPCIWSCMGRVAFCLKYNYIFLWQKRHDFNRIVFAQGAGSVVGAPHFEFMIFIYIAMARTMRLSWGYAVLWLVRKSVALWLPVIDLTGAWVVSYFEFKYIIYSCGKNDTILIAWAS